MLAEEQRLKIAEIIKEETVLKYPNWLKINVSESTIRRDLNELEKSGVILRTLGGVYKGINRLKAIFIEKQDKYAEEKDKIGNITAKEVEDGDTIILDSGNTGLVPYLWTISLYFS